MRKITVYMHPFNNCTYCGFKMVFYRGRHKETQSESKFLARTAKRAKNNNDGMKG